MAESLRDQLLKTGLAKKTIAKKKSSSSSRKSTNKGSSTASDLARAWKARDQEEKNAAKQRIELKQAEQKRRRKINDQIVALLASGTQNKSSADISRNFFHFGKIRKVMVDQQQLTQLNSGLLSVAYLRGRYYLVDNEIAEQVRQLSPEHVPDLKGSDNKEEAEHPVPDDLIW